MNLYILFLVSLPEAILNIIIFLLFAGRKDNIKINKPNAFRFTISLVLMLVATNFIRPVAPNVLVNIVLHIVAYTAIFIMVYRINIAYALLSVGFMSLVYSTVENAYLPYLVAYVSKGLANLEKQYLLYPLYALPNRIFQIFIIWFLRKYQVLIVTKISKRFHMNFIIITYLIIIVEFFLLFHFYAYYDKMPLIHQVAFSSVVCGMAIGFNLLVFKLVYNVIYGIVNKGYLHYSEFEDNVKYVFGEIQALLKQNKVDEAIKLIDELNSDQIDGKTIKNGGEK